FQDLVGGVAFAGPDVERDPLAAFAVLPDLVVAFSLTLELVTGVPQYAPELAGVLRLVGVYPDLGQTAALHQRHQYPLDKVAGEIGHLLSDLDDALEAVVEAICFKGYGDSRHVLDQRHDKRVVVGRTAEAILSRRGAGAMRTGLSPD